MIQSLYKHDLMLNKHAYFGMCKLGLRKVLIHKFRYDCIKNNFGNNSRLLFAGTDSLMY